MSDSAYPAMIYAWRSEGNQMSNRQTWVGLSIKPEPRADAEAISKFEVSALTFMSQAYEKATAYDNVIIVAGYAAFFALWSGVARDLPRPAALWIVAMMIVSMTGYLGFNVWVMIGRSVVQLRNLQLLTSDKRPEEIAAVLQAMNHPTKATSRVLSYWFFALMITIGAALPAGGLLEYNAVALALGYNGWPS